MAAFTTFTPSFTLILVAILLLILTSLLTPTQASPPTRLPAPDPQSPAQLSEQAVNMNVSNLGEALFLLSSVFISAVQPQEMPKVALQFIFPDIGLQKGKLGDFDLLFNSQRRQRSPSSVEVTSVMTWTKKQKPGPGEVLQALCNDTFRNNVVTVLHINNPKVSRDFKEVSRYLTQLLESVGLPVISWDSDFSAARQVRDNFRQRWYCAVIIIEACVRSQHGDITTTGNYCSRKTSACLVTGLKHQLPLVW